MSDTATGRHDGPRRPLGAAADGTTPILLADGTTVERRSADSLGASLRELLERRARGDEGNWSAARCAKAIRDIAHVLSRMHARDLVHGDVRPEHLLADPSTGGLLLRSSRLTPGRPDDANAAAVATTRRARTHGSWARGADRHLAPELFIGEHSPLIDQYALGVTAREALSGPGMPPLTAPVRAVLQRATAPRPGQRYPTAAAFGDALVAAIEAEEPSTLADRAARASPEVRAAWEPTAVAVAIGVLSTFQDARDGGAVDGPLLGPLVAVLLIGMFGVLTFLIVRFAAMFGAGRRRLLVPFAYRPELAPALLAAVVAVRATGDGSVDEAIVSSVPSLWLVYGVRGLIGRPRAETGSWVSVLLRRWDRRLILSPARRRAVELAGLAATVAVLVAPTLAGRTWSIPPQRWRIVELDSTTAVWNFRLAVFQGDAVAACRLARLAPHPGRADCRAIVAVATSIQRADPAADRPTTVFGGSGDADRFLVEPVPAPANRRLFSLLGPDGRELGYMYSEGPGVRKLVMLLSRDGPYDARERLRDIWLYELAWQDDRWWITGFRACRLAAPGSGASTRCLITDEASTPRVRAAQRAIARARTGAGG